MTTTPPHSHDDWTSAEFAAGWLERSERGLPERQRRFRLAAALLGFGPDDAFHFLDVGAGAGPLAAVLLEQFPRSTAVCLDVSGTMLARGAEALAGFGDRARFVQSDLAAPSWTAALGGQRFQAAVSSIAIHNLFDAPAIQNVYRELAGVLAPGALFANIDYVAGEPALQANYRAAAAQRRVERGDTPATPGQGSGGGGHFVGALTDHFRWLQAGGFVAVDCPWRELNLAIVLAQR